MGVRHAWLARAAHYAPARAAELCSDLGAASCSASCAAGTARSAFHVAPSPRGSTGSCAESDAASFGDGRNQDRHSKRKADLFLGRALSAFLFSSVFRLFFGRALSAFSEGLIGADTCE